MAPSFCPGPVEPLEKWGGGGGGFDVEIGVGGKDNHEEFEI